MLNPKSKLLILIITLGFLTLPLTCWAAEILPGCISDGNCGLCDIIQTGINIFRWILGILGGAALLLFVWHAFGFLIAGGNKEKIETSKKALIHTVIGIIIILGSWFLVNMVIVLLTGAEGGVGKIFSGQAWNEYCKGEITTYKPTTFASNITEWQFSPGIGNQIADISPALNQMMECLRKNLPPGVGRISSISDSNHIGNLRPCEQQNGCPENCAHTCGSCHYGGGLGDNKSHAIDLGDDENYDAIRNAIANCDEYVGHFLRESDHIHISTSDCPRS